jgi:hypothetical protein
MSGAAARWRPMPPLFRGCHRRASHDGSGTTSFHVREPCFVGATNTALTPARSWRRGRVPRIVFATRWWRSSSPSQYSRAVRCLRSGSRRCRSAIRGDVRVLAGHVDRDPGAGNKGFTPVLSTSGVSILVIATIAAFRCSPTLDAGAVPAGTHRRRHPPALLAAFPRAARSWRPPPRCRPEVSGAGARRARRGRCG